jgi:hypothetical protein
VIGASRKSPRNATAKAFVDVTANNDQTSERRQQGDVLDRVLSIYVRVTRQGTGDELDDLMDRDEVRVHNAIMSHDWSSLVVEHPVPVQTNFTTSGEGQQDIVTLVTRFDFQYCVALDDLTVAIV